jgi:RNase P subunit RPR2
MITEIKKYKLVCDKCKTSLVVESDHPTTTRTKELVSFLAPTWICEFDGYEYTYKILCEGCKG